MSIFGNTKIDIIKRVNNGIVVAMTNAKGALKCERLSAEENEHDMTIPMVMTLNGIPIVQMHLSYCPTCCGLLATGYGLDAAKCSELAEISDSINKNFVSIDASLEVIKPLIGLLEDGVYLIRDTKTFPTDGDNKFFWEVPDELTYYNAFCEEYYISKFMECVELEGVFIYPTQSPDKYDESRVQYYMDLFGQKTEKPRAIAYNAMGGMSALLDGHHKACAAARLKIPLDTIVITKGYLTGNTDIMKIIFGYDQDTEFFIDVNNTCGLPKKLYKQYIKYMEDVWKKRKRPEPKLYSGLPVESKFTKREWEKCYTDSVKYYPYADQLAAEIACGYDDTDDMSEDELYNHVYQQEEPVYYAQALIRRLVRTDDKRAKGLLLRFARLPVSGYTKQIIGTALKYLIHFKSDETEKIFIDFVVSDDEYLADIAKDYWEDEK